MTDGSRTRSLDRIAKDFSPAERASVIELLSGYSGPENGRVTWDILALSNGRLDKVRQYIQVAQIDYRDILYWAEYYENDPMLRGRDSKQFAQEILIKWGDKNR